MMDDREIQRPHGAEYRPVRISRPSFCCVRDCDREAVAMHTVATEDGLLLYATCSEHATMELPDG